MDNRQKNLEEIIKKAENLKVEEEVKEEETITEPTDETSEEELTSQEVLEEASDETLEETPKEPVKKEEAKPQKEEKGEEIDYKERYRGSTQEAMVLTERNKFYQEAVEKADKLPPPTEEDLVKEYGEEEVSLMDETQKKIALDALLAKRKMAIIKEAVEKDKKVEEWINQVKTFVKDPNILSKYPELEGNEEDFVRFSAMPTRIGLDLESLTKIFLFDHRPKPKKESLLLTKTSGRQEEKPNKISVSEAALIRRTNPRLYKKLIKEGKIDFGI